VIAFVEKFLLGDTTTNTDSIAISTYDPDLSSWITWDTPELEEPPSFTGDFYLVQNYPNPFNSVTTVVYYLKQKSHVQLSVYDITGEKIRTLLNEQQSAGKQTLIFDGSELASGIYICTLKVGEFTQSRKMMLLH